MRTLLMLLGMLCLTAQAAEGQDHTLTVNGERRSYRLFVPAPATNEPRPLLLVLHGGLGNAAQVERSTAMNSVASAAGFMVAYPNGTGGRLLRNQRTWNAGQCCGRAAKEQVDDVAFIQAMLVAIDQQQALDATRVYATGHSNGAMLSYRLACELPGVFAAIVPVAGTLTLDDCPGAQTTAVLHIHGSADSHVPFNGGVGANSIAGVHYRGVRDSLQLLAAARGCGSEQPAQTLADGSTLTRWQCPQAPVQLRLVPGGEHVWPGGHSRRNRRNFGGDFSASQAVWDFAQSFTSKGRSAWVH